MRLFITGATGFIGSAIAARAVSRGHSVLGLARSASSAAALEAAGHEAVRGDLTDATVIAAAVRDSDGAVHAAGSTVAHHLAALRAMLPAMSGSAKPLVYTSGSLIYGETGPTAVPESHPLSRDWVGWHIVDEDLVLDPTWGIRGSSIRVPLAYGRGGGNLQVQLRDMAAHLGHGTHVEAGQNRWSTCYTDDLADLFVLAAESAPAGAVYNGSSGDISMAEWAQAYSHAVGRPGEVVSWSYPEARQNLGSFADTWQLNQLIDGNHARDGLGWQPTGPAPFAEFAHGSYALAS